MSKSGFAKAQLRSFIERVERLEEEKASLAADIREIYSEAKGSGFCAKTMRAVIKLRKLDTADRQEQEAMLDLYLSALGMGRDELICDEPEIEIVYSGSLPPHDAETGEIFEDNSASQDDYRPTAGIEAMQDETDVHRGGNASSVPVSAMPEQGCTSSRASYQYDAGEVHGRCEPTSPPMHADAFDADRDMPSFLRRGAPELVAAG